MGLAPSSSGKLRYSAMKLARSMPLAVPFSRSTPFTSSSLERWLFWRLFHRQNHTGFAICNQLTTREAILATHPVPTPVISHEPKRFWIILDSYEVPWNHMEPGTRIKSQPSHCSEFGITVIKQVEQNIRVLRDVSMA